MSATTGNSSVVRTGLLFGLLSICGAADGGQRFTVIVPTSDTPVLSILMPLGWYPDSNGDADKSEDSSDNVRVAFTPVKGMYPLVLLDIGGETAPEQLVTAADSAEHLALLAGGEPGEEYCDSTRKLLWRTTELPSSSNITVKLLHRRPVRLQFVFNRSLSNEFRSTVVNIVDSLQLAPETTQPPTLEIAAARERFKDQDVIPFTLSAESITGIANLQWKIAAAVLAVLLVLVIWERVLRARRDANRIQAAELASEQRRSGRRPARQ